MGAGRQESKKDESRKKKKSQKLASLLLSDLLTPFPLRSYHLPEKVGVRAKQTGLRRGPPSTHRTTPPYPARSASAKLTTPGGDRLHSFICVSQGLRDKQDAREPRTDEAKGG